jgi:hypothetical protein
MRVIVTGDRFWACHNLAAAVLGRLVARYGPGVVIVHGDGTGVDESFATAAEGHGIAVEAHPADWERLGDRAAPVRNQEMVDAGAGMCLALHRYLANSKGTRDCVRREIEAGVPTYLIDSDTAGPRRLRAGDARLG